MLYKPFSRKIATCYKGTKLNHRWPDDCQGFQGGYYEAKVVAVPQIPVEGDEGGIYLTLECKPSNPALARSSQRPSLCCNSSKAG